MSFCVNCGTEIKRSSAKFCPKCGCKLDEPDEDTRSVASVTTSNIQNKIEIPKTMEIGKTEELGEEESPSPNMYDLGVKLENAVEKILRAEGYSTQKRQRLEGEKGTSEIDIVATRIYNGRKEIIAVECKNHNAPISVKEIRDFDSKLKDLNIKNGLFAVHPDFSSDASQWGENAGLMLWNWDIVREKIAEIEIGRLGHNEQTKLDCYLPLKIDFEKAVALKIQNKDNVVIESAKLIWKPFYKIIFHLKYTRTLPNKEKRFIEDSGFYVVDGISGEIIKQSETMKNVINQLFGQSEDTSLQIKENDIVLKELEQAPEENLTLGNSFEYKIIPLNPSLNKEKALKRVTVRIVKVNTETVNYSLKNDDLFDDPREFTMTPSEKDIRIDKTELIYVPRWEIEFDSKDYKYHRKICGNSGKILSDTIAHCPDDSFISNANIAVCDVCGKALCEDHIFKCPVCKKWHCKSHGVQCTVCKQRYCPEHAEFRCVECKGIICNACILKCPICGEIHCKSHMTKCSKCNKIVCVSCTRKEGNFLLKKSVCKECQ